MTAEIAEFLANVYKPSNLDSAPEKLRKAIKLLEGVLTYQNPLVVATWTKDGWNGIEVQK